MKYSSSPNLSLTSCAHLNRFGTMSSHKAWPTSNGSYLVLPSQLNCAEYIAPYFISKYILEYKRDRTGGPAAQCSVNLNIGQFILDYAHNSNNDSNINGINMVDDFIECYNNEKQDTDKIKLINGYLEIPKNNYLDDIINHLEKIKIFCFKNLPINNNIIHYGKYENKNGNLKVNFIYASGVPIEYKYDYFNRINNYYEIKIFNEIKNYSNGRIFYIASIINTIQYYNSLCMAFEDAIEKGKLVKIFLFALGAGVFNNYSKNVFYDIIRAIHLVEYKFCNYNINKYLEIKLITYNEKNTYTTYLKEYIKSEKTKHESIEYIDELLKYTYNNTLYNNNYKIKLDNISNMKNSEITKTFKKYICTPYKKK